MPDVHVSTVGEREASVYQDVITLDGWVSYNKYNGRERRCVMSKV